MDSDASREAPVEFFVRRRTFLGLWSCRLDCLLGLVPKSEDLDEVLEAKVISDGATESVAGFAGLSVQAGLVSSDICCA